MKRNLYIALTAILTSLLACGLTACSSEDDLDEIFVGRTWYMNGAIINGKRLNDEIKHFYTDAGEGAYYLSFSSGTFQGVLTMGVAFSGTWSADGKAQSITLNVTNTSTVSSPFDKQILNILSATSFYRSGDAFMQLGEDDNNVVLFGSSRSKVYN